MKDSVIQQLKQSILDRIKYLEKLDEQGVLLPNECIHKTNELKSLLTTINSFAEREKTQTIQLIADSLFYNWSGDSKFEPSYSYFTNEAKEFYEKNVK
jgi:hypothetical protein